MTTFQQYERQFVTALIGASAQDAPIAAAAMMPSLQALLDAMPYYRSTAWDAAHRAGLVNLLQTELPNDSVAAQPEESGLGYVISYRYSGSYSGYREAFYTGIQQTAAASAAAVQATSVKPSLDSGWWGRYGVAVLTDAVRQVAGLGLDTGKLAGDLGSYHANLLPALSATYLGIYTTGYAPTATAYQAIVTAGQTAQAQAQLNTAILAGQFSADINQAIAMGGDSTAAAVWFLFNLWITLKALGTADVDGAIRAYQSAGLTVPAQVGPGSWWNGGYSSWYLALSGSDVRSGTITAELPESAVAIVSNRQPLYYHVNVPNGYAQSLCYWGPLNGYRPPPDSCFGAGTAVRMADGSAKPIEQVKRGDIVQTTLGPRPVLLVEAPARAARTLYRFAGTRVVATAGHPFRAAASAPVHRLAVDPWALGDAVPTMLRGGIGALTGDVRLSGDLAVPAIEALPASGDGAETVYDLIIGESGSPAYYVGGPEVFFAVDAETADPSFHLPATIGISAMMHALLPVLRRHPPEATAELLRTAIGSIGTRDVAVEAEGDAAGDGSLPEVPGAGFFTRPDDSWDEQASTLEAQLVRRFARMLRREACGPRPAPAAGGELAVIVHDFELIGETVPAGAAGEVIVELRDAEAVQAVPVTAADEARGFVTVDEAVGFGRVAEDATLVVTLSIASQTVARARVPAGCDGIEHLLFTPEGRVIGRIAVEPLRIAPGGLAVRHTRPATVATAAAARFGRRMAGRIAAAMGGLRPALRHG